MAENATIKDEQYYVEKTIKESVLQEAEYLINGDRAKQYGPAKKSFSDIAYGWSKILGVDVKPEQVALCMIWLKMMRFQNGNPDRDSVVDMAGYAGTIEKVLGETLT